MLDLPENHRFEQFFFDAPTTARLTRIAQGYRRPLLVCLPSIAAALAEASKKPRYILLDRDTRFQHLPHYQPFDLFRPHMVLEEFDAILCDPPFSNITLPQLRETLDLLARCPSRRPALYLCYIASREEALLDTFRPDGLARLPGGPLGYQSVAARTQANIFLYGPPGV